MTRADLAAALREAREGSRKLDGILFLLNDPATECVLVTKDNKVIVDQHVPEYTTSIDAALTLFPLPGYRIWRMRNSKSGEYETIVIADVPDDMPSVKVAARDTCLAICLWRLEYDNLKGTE